MTNIHGQSGQDHHRKGMPRQPFPDSCGRGGVIHRPHRQDIAEKMVERIKDKLYHIIRKMNPNDDIKIKGNERVAREAFYKVLQKVKERELDMKLTAVDYTFDRGKLFIYYTAEGRIDFRELVKDMGYIFKTRIQMVQIGVRDETKLMGGYGGCGRELCCCTFIKDFKPVSIDMAKEQELSLNPTKISGICGRLMCCLSYEDEFYKNAKKHFPRKGSKVNTKKGAAIVREIDVLKNRISVKYENGEVESIPVSEIASGILGKLGIKKDKKENEEK